MKWDVCTGSKGYLNYTHSSLSLFNLLPSGKKYTLPYHQIVEDLHSPGRKTPELILNTPLSKTDVTRLKDSSFIASKYIYCHFLNMGLENDNKLIRCFFFFFFFFFFHEHRFEQLVFLILCCNCFLLLFSLLCTQRVVWKMYWPPSWFIFLHVCHT